MTPAEAAAYRAGVEAGARVADHYKGSGSRTVILDHVAAAIRALPVPAAVEVTEDDDLPNEVMRAVGTRWLELYGDHDDKAFIAAAVYRIMRQAKRTPDHYELAALRADVAADVAEEPEMSSIAMARAFRLCAIEYNGKVCLSDTELRACLDAALRARSRS